MRFILFLGTAFGLGAFHAVEPGHGKTVIAAYIVGSRGSAWEAVLLGLVVAITHTASVITLGVASLLVASQWTDVASSKVIGVVSGAIIVAIGLWLLVARSRNLLLTRGGTSSHSSVSDYENHSHHHTHGHHHHSHEGPAQNGEQKSLLQILALGISGGLVPCPAALVVLLVSLRSGEIADGLTYLLAFSLGVACVLVALGLIVNKAATWASRYLEKPWLAGVASIASAVLIIGAGAYTVWQAVSG